MVGLGTIVDVVAIIGGGLVGMIFQQFISPQLRRIVMQTLGLAVIFVGMAGTLSHMLRIAANGQLTTINSMMLIISLTIGGILGWLLHLENAVTYLAQWFKRIFKRQNDTRFITGFISATIPTCVGAMLIIGALQDGLQHCLLRRFWTVLQWLFLQLHMGWGHSWQQFQLGCCKVG